MDVNEPPTPVVACVAHAKLSIEGRFSLGQLPPGEYRALIDDQVFHLAIEHTSGLLDRTNSRIYLKAGMVPGRRNFVTLHEVGHGWLPWQRLHPTHPDGEQNLDPDTRAREEWEANVFAAETLFQLDRFEREARDLPLELQSAMALADRFEASVHASLRRFVERHDQRAVLLVLERHPVVRPAGAQHRVVAVHWSRPFRRRYPQWKRPRWLPAALFAPLRTKNVAVHFEGELPLDTGDEVVSMALQGFRNEHHILLFGRPRDGQRLPRRMARSIVHSR